MPRAVLTNLNVDRTMAQPGRWMARVEFIDPNGVFRAKDFPRIDDDQAILPLIQEALREFDPSLPEWVMKLPDPVDEPSVPFDVEDAEPERKPQQFNPPRQSGNRPVPGSWTQRR